MNFVSKASAFPPTVQPGHPTLERTPEGWVKAPIGRFLKENRRPVRLQDYKMFDLVTVKRARGGVVVREQLSGRDISVKSQFRIEADDFLISKRQIVHGACGLVPTELAGSIVSNEYAVLKTEEGLDRRFLSYLSHTPYFQQTCFHSSIGVHVEKMIFKLDRWFRWEFNLPPPAEQKKIAEILSTWDKAIETTETLLANAETQKRALMQQLLTGKRRLKGFEGSEWKTVTLGDALIIEYGKSPKAIISSEGRYPIIGTGGETGRTDEFLIDTPAIVIGRKGTIDKPTMIEEPFWPIDTTFSCLAKPDFDIRWVFRALQRVDLRRYNEASGVPSLSRDTLRSIHIVAPPKDEQAAIRGIIDHADQECMAIRHDVASLQLQKRALMQQLLTGKRRVAV